MSDQSVNAILQHIDVLAAKLGLTAQFLWAVMLRQARVQLITDVVWIAVWIIGVCLARGLFTKWIAEWRTEVEASREHGAWLPEFTTEHGGRAFTLVLVALAIVFVTIYVLCSFTEIPTVIWNPEYWALQQIIK